MRFSSFFLATLAVASAQILTRGNTKLPTCALGCPKLNQAVDACSGQTEASLGTWSCFCQSGYLKTLAQSAVGVCDDVCTAAADLQSVATWYATECGQDFGQAEHVNSASGNTGSSSSSSGSPAQTTARATNVPTSAISGGYDGSMNQTQSGPWFANHWRWVVMLIILFIGLLLFAAVLMWLKHRSERRRDAAPYGWNSGITERVVPTQASTSVVGQPPLAAGVRRDSSPRGKIGMLPYGSNYSLSTSRVASQTNMSIQESRRTGFGGGDLEKAAFVTETTRSVPADAITPVNDRRVRVRERGGRELNEKI